MKKLFTLSLLMANTCVTVPAFAQNEQWIGDHLYSIDEGVWRKSENGKLGSEIAAGRLIVHFRAGSSPEDLVNRSVVSTEDVLISEIGLGYWLLEYSLTPTESFLKAKRLLNHSDHVLDIELDLIGQLHATPDDSYYDGSYEQWNLYSGMLNMPNAWNITRGSTDVVVAVLDTGVDWQHEDLVGNIWQNLGEDYDNDGKTIEFVGGQWVLDSGDINNTDDDGNGEIDDLIGWDFEDGDRDPFPDGIFPNYPNPHGTMSAGIVAARSNNNQGIAGIAGGWDSESGVQLMPIRLDYRADSGQYMSGMATAVNYAVDAGANVISISLGWSSTNGALETAVENAYDNNVVVVASAGNGGTADNVQFPASHDEVIAVVAVLETDEAYSGNDYGPEVDIAAPGGANAIPTTDITGTDPSSSQDQIDTEYTYFGGTSAAAPHVAGVAALILSINPTLNPAQVKSVITSTAEAVGFEYLSYPNDEVGHGKINAFAALKKTIEDYGGTFDQDVLLDSDVQWNVSSGVTLDFGSGHTLIVKDKLVVNGSSGDEVVFTSSGSSWGGIDFQSGSEHSILNDSVIDNVDSGSSGAVAEVNASDIEFNSVKLVNDTGSTTYGVIVTGADFEVVDSYIDSPNGDALSVQSSLQMNVYNTDFRNTNSAHTGLGAISGAWIQVSDSEFDGSGQAWDASGSYTIIDGDNADNHFCSSATTLMSASSSATITAENNYWPAGGPSGHTSTSSGGSIDVWPYQGSSATCSLGVSKNISTRFSGNSLAHHSDLNSETWKSIRSASIAMSRRDYFEAEESLHHAISIRSDVIGTNTAIGGLVISDRSTVNDENITILLELTTEHAYRESALSALSKIFMQRGDVTSSIKQLELLETEFPSGLAAFYSRLFVARTLWNKSDSEGALAMVSDMQPNTKQSAAALNVFRSKLSSMIVEYVPDETNSNEGSQTTLASNGSRLSTYPNPFNPSTTVRFELASRERITLSVYDTLGREIARLADGILPAGIHSYRYNGERMMSGIYYVKLTTSKTTESIRVVFLK